jgi:hypothetical protein
MPMLCGKCEKSHETVAEVKACYGIVPVPDKDPADIPPANNGPTDKQWAFYKDLAFQLGRKVSDNERRLFSFDKISSLITEMRAEVTARPPKQVVNGSVNMSGVPEGRYATPSLTGNNDYDFWKVDKPTEGRWAGYTFLNRVIGGKPDVPVRGAQKIKAFAAILDFGIEKAKVTFGQELGQCYECGRHLTDKTSRILGIGPDCLAKKS